MKKIAQDTNRVRKSEFFLREHILNRLYSSMPRFFSRDGNKIKLKNFTSIYQNVSLSCSDDDNVVNIRKLNKSICSTSLPSFHLSTFSFFHVFFLSSTTQQIFGTWGLSSLALFFEMTNKCLCILSCFSVIFITFFYNERLMLIWWWKWEECDIWEVLVTKRKIFLIRVDFVGFFQVAIILE